MSPESFVSGVVRAHLRALECAWGTRVLSRFRAVWADEGWPVFTLSVFLLVFFLFPPHPHRTLPSTQTLISQISEKVGPFHFLSIYSSPVDGMLPSVGTGGHGRLLRARSSQACPPVRLCSLLFGPAGGQDQEWVDRSPCLACFCCLRPRCTSYLHVPLAGLPCRGGQVGMVHGTKLHPTFVPRPGQLSVPGGAQA